MPTITNAADELELVEPLADPLAEPVPVDPLAAEPPEDDEDEPVEEPAELLEPEVEPVTLVPTATLTSDTMPSIGELGSLSPERSARHRPTPARW
ncbi:MAG TPA: hypothetical protein VIC62_06075 [Nakamurella sp.]